MFYGLLKAKEWKLHLQDNILKTENKDYIDVLFADQFFLSKYIAKFL